MNPNLKALYVAIVDNEVVCFDTNLTKFYKQISNMESSVKPYQWLYREFSKNNRFSLTLSDKEYFFQKVL